MNNISAKLVFFFHTPTFMLKKSEKVIKKVAILQIDSQVNPKLPWS